MHDVTNEKNCILTATAIMAINALFYKVETLNASRSQKERSGIKIHLTFVFIQEYNDSYSLLGVINEIIDLFQQGAKR